MKEKEDRTTQPLKGNKEKWVCKKCNKPIELWGKNSFIANCECINLDDDLDIVGKRIDK